MRSRYDTTEYLQNTTITSKHGHTAAVRGVAVAVVVGGGGGASTFALARAQDTTYPMLSNTAVPFRTEIIRRRGPGQEQPA